MLENDDKNWTYVFDDLEMTMLGNAAKDSLTVPEIAEAMIEDMAERIGITQAQAGGIMFAGLSYVSSKDGCFKQFLSDWCKDQLEMIEQIEEKENA